MSYIVLKGKNLLKDIIMLKKKRNKNINFKNNAPFIKNQ